MKLSDYDQKIKELKEKKKRLLEGIYVKLGKKIYEVYEKDNNLSDSSLAKIRDVILETFRDENINNQERQSAAKSE